MTMAAAAAPPPPPTANGHSEATSLLSDNKTLDIDDDDSSSSNGRKRWWLVAIPCVALIGMAAVLLLILPIHNHERHVRKYRHQGHHHNRAHSSRHDHGRDDDSVPTTTTDGDDEQQPTNSSTAISVAFIGNSMLYFNDIPRLLETLSDGRMTQHSCLHGGATLTTILETGSGMAIKFNTPNAEISSSSDTRATTSSTLQIPDLGACTVPMLLFGRDERLEQQLQERHDDPSSIVRNETSDLEDDRTNPCLIQNETRRGDYYSNYLQQQHHHIDTSPPHYDFIVMNDNTRSPGRLNTRQQSLEVLETTYLPWLVDTQATPVFLDTHAYMSPSRNLTEFVDIPVFTSVTYQGYVAYANLLADNLPQSQQPRIALSGIAFLVVWEEDYELWLQLFHSDQLHCSPTGSYLEALMIYHALWQSLPDPSVSLPDDMASLWHNARVMQPADDPVNPFPTRQQAEYLYGIADRVAVQNYRPKSLQLNVVAPTDEQESDSSGNESE